MMPTLELANYFETYHLRHGGVYHIRAVRLDDRQRIEDLFESYSDRTRYLRFAHAISTLDRDFIDRIIHVDYNTEMALVAETVGPDSHLLGISRYLVDEKPDRCEFSLVVTDAAQGEGVGFHLLNGIIECAKYAGYHEMHGLILAQNTDMLHLVSHVGFKLSRCFDEPDYKRASFPLTV
jgi:acetyltransferase